MKKVVVTGANGFIGTALCRELISQNIEVIAIVRDKTKVDFKIISSPNLRVVCCEMKDFRKLYEYIGDRDIDVLYHLAWEGSAGVLRGNSDTQINNIKYTCDTVKVCKKLNCRRFVFASSIMEYETDAVIVNGKYPSINTLYSSAKRAAEYMTRAIASSQGTEYIGALISNIYGAGEYSPRLINTSLRKLLSGKHCAFSAGEQLYDFIYISDAAKAFVALGDKGKSGKMYYIGSHKPKPLKEFLCEMRDVVNPNIEIGLGEVPFNGVSLKYDEFSITGLKEDTGFVPQVSFTEGIKNTIAWLKECK